MRFDTKYVTKAALIAAMYVVLILVQMIPAASFTFGAVQLRLAEGLTLLPFVEAAAIPGVFLGCLISNIILAGVSGLGLVDVIGGSLVTLAAAYLTSKAKNKYLAAVPPVLLNGLIVSIWVNYYTNMPYGITVLGIAGGEALSVFLFGGLVLYVYERSKIFRRF